MGAAHARIYCQCQELNPLFVLVAKETGGGIHVVIKQMDLRVPSLDAHILDMYEHTKLYITTCMT